MLARLSGADQNPDSLARHLALEQEISGTPLSLGNQVVLLEDGPNTYAAMLSAIEAARDHINMETYIFEDDEAGQRFADALIAKRAQGVQVNLIHDSVGTRRTPKEFFQRLKDAGIAVLEFNPVNPLAAKAGWEVNQRDHRKLLVVDGRIAVLGGINISSVYSSGSSSARAVPAATAAARRRRRTACPGATPTCGSRGRWSRSCRSSSWKRGKARRGRRSSRATTSRC